MTAGGTAPARTVGSVAGEIWKVVALPVVSIFLALIVGAVVILLSELIVPDRTFDPTLPVTAYLALLEGSFGSPGAILNTLVTSAPRASS
jgi:ABC-type uncharacterized transport system permease subunit